MPRQERNFSDDDSDGETFCYQENDFNDPQKFIFSESSKYIEKYHLFPEKCDEKQINSRKEQELGESESDKNLSLKFTLLSKNLKHSIQTKDLILKALLLELESNEMHICILRDNSEIRMSHNCSANGTDQSQIKAFSNVSSGLSTLISPLLSFFKPNSSEKTSDLFSNASSTGSRGTLSQTYISERKNSDVIGNTDGKNHSVKCVGDNGNGNDDVILRYGEMREFQLPGWREWLDSFEPSNMEALSSIHHSGMVSQRTPDADTYTVFLLDESDSIDNEGINIMRETVLKIVSGSLVRIVLLTDGHPTRSTTESIVDPPQDICIDEDNREEIQDRVIPYLREHHIPVFTVPCSCEDHRDKDLVADEISNRLRNMPTSREHSQQDKGNISRGS
ncbi:hypothetical protein FSP39_017378 [Pinctada imbricata]|uniref:Uncharacterized protein n=1 Tax=Pinctada imbricata TaxID=66713 RepID=A0AA88YJT6_PINIB|nr:hypothetical protein FSP39_017378 [Pinctada imbricata]